LGSKPSSLIFNLRVVVVVFLIFRFWANYKLVLLILIQHTRIWERPPRSPPLGANTAHSRILEHKIPTGVPVNPHNNKLIIHV